MRNKVLIKINSNDINQKTSKLIFEINTVLSYNIVFGTLDNNKESKRKKMLNL